MWNIIFNSCIMLLSSRDYDLIIQFFLMDYELI